MYMYVQMYFIRNGFICEKYVLVTIYYIHVCCYKFSDIMYMMYMQSNDYQSFVESNLHRYMLLKSKRVKSYLYFVTFTIHNQARYFNFLNTKSNLKLQLAVCYVALSHYFMQFFISNKFTFFLYIYMYAYMHNISKCQQST